MPNLQQPNSLVGQRHALRDNESGIQGLTEVDLSSTNMEAIGKAQQIHKSYNLKKKAKEFPVSTNDSDVKSCLRQLGVPICLFGEDAGFRRERLKLEIL
jgi:U4/U6 small nuclear ribonucleoprotein PRP4